MNVTRQTVQWILLVGCGVALVWAGFALPGPQSSDTYEYRAAELQLENDSIVLVDRSTGEAVDRPLGREVLDDRVLCFTYENRACQLERAHRDGEVSLRAEAGRVEYLYEGGQEFYRVPQNHYEQTGGEYERRPPEAVFEDLAVERHRLIDAERRVLEEDSALVHHRLPHDQRIVRDDGDYVVFLTFGQTGSDPPSPCVGYGDFCEEASAHRDRLVWRNRFVSLLGAVAVVVGSVGAALTLRRRAS